MNIRRRVLTLLTCFMLTLGFANMTLSPVSAFGDDLGTEITDGGDKGNSENTTTNNNSSQKKKSNNTQSGTVESPIPKEPLDDGTQSMSDFISEYQPVTPEQMEEGKEMAKPISQFIGKIITVALALLTVWMFLQTVIDLAFILVPATQPSLSGQAQVPGKVSRCWVTSEALQAAGRAGMNRTQQGGRGMRSPMGYGGSMGGMGYGGSMGGMGYGGGMGMRGGMSAGGMNAGAPQQTTSNMMMAYFKSRTVTLILFGICIIMLFSNIFLDFGTVLGGWIYSIFTYFGNMLR